MWIKTLALFLLFNLYKFEATPDSATGTDATPPKDTTNLVRLNLTKLNSTVLEELK